MSDRIPLKDAAHGRWKDILLQLGFSSKMLSGKHGPCPICDGGTDRFRFDDKGRGTWICSHCGAGDGISLVMQTQGVDFKGAAALIEPLIGGAAVERQKPMAGEEENRRWRREAWLGSMPITADDPAGRWLATVGLASFPRCLRYHPNLEHRDGDGRRTRHPAMLALVTAPDGTPTNLHRTYLDAAGRKADVDKPRMMMPGTVTEGSSIRLFDEGDLSTIGVAEGIETALAAAALRGLPVWSAIDAGKLSKWRPPAAARKVIVFCDNDSNFAGQHAAFQLANRLVVKDKIEVEVSTPPTIGHDWRDVYAARNAMEHA